MKIATLVLDNHETAALMSGQGFLPLSGINLEFKTEWPEDLFTILNQGKLDELREWVGTMASTINKDLFIPAGSVKFAPLYRHPRKIWGIGLNYKAHADDLSEKLPDTEPASFMKPDTTIIGYGDTVKIPELSQKTTGEAELGIIFGKQCGNVKREEWRSVIAGFTTIIDMTAEDILRRNPRNLTQSKSFDTFFSFGPIFYTIDEIGDPFNLTVRTVINGKIHAENTVSNMTWPLDYLVAYHSNIMTMLPGDIISTGTPGAAPLKHGDTIECRIGDFLPLMNSVVDLKKQGSSR